MHDDEKNITLDKAVDELNQPPPSTQDNECLGGCLSVLVSRCLGVSVWRQQSDNNTPVTGHTGHTGQWSVVRAAPAPHLARKPDNSVHISTAALTASKQYIYSTGNNTE